MKMMKTLKLDRDGDTQITGENTRITGKNIRKWPLKTLKKVDRRHAKCTDVMTIQNFSREHLSLSKSCGKSTQISSNLFPNYLFRIWCTISTVYFVKLKSKFIPPLKSFSTSSCLVKLLSHYKTYITLHITHFIVTAS